MTTRSHLTRRGLVTTAATIGLVTGGILVNQFLVGPTANAAVQQAGRQAAGQQPMPVERAKILTDPGVFGVFAAFKLRPEWSRLTAVQQQAAQAAVHKVVDTHKRVLVDAYLTRGLSERADYFLRLHAYDLAEAQACVVAFMETTLGRNSELVETFVGVTKPTNYLQKDQALQAAMKSASYEGRPPRYVIVIPTQKNAEWWNLPPDKRLQELKTHIQPTVPFLTSVNRKLYHSSGLDDLDFITYFETNNLSGFNDLVIALLSIPENKYNRRLGDPTLLGSIGSVDDLLKGLQ